MSAHPDTAPDDTQAPDWHPLVARLAAMPHASRVTPETLVDWCAGAGPRVLVLPGDPIRHPEGLDVAVVLPEVRSVVHPTLTIGVADRASDAALAAHFGVQRWPNLVFLRDGAYLGVLPGMHDWEDFVRQVAQLLQAAPSRKPGIGIPVVAAGGAAAASCSSH